MAGPGDSGSGQEARTAVDREADAGRVYFLEQALWRQLSEPADADAFFGAWLALLCRMIPGARRGVLLLSEPDDGSLAPCAYWPDANRGTARLSAACDLAIGQRRGVVHGAPTGDRQRPSAICAIAFPCIADGQLYGVVAVEQSVVPELDPRETMRQLQWGAAWIELMVRRTRGEYRNQAVDRSMTALGLIATCLEEARFRPACTAVVTELANRLECDRVSIGFERHGRIGLAALSHSAHFAKRMNLVRTIEMAMAEAYDQRAAVLFPPAGDDRLTVTAAHAELADSSRSGSILSVPLTAGERYLGALTCERPSDRPFEPPTIELVEAVACAIGSILDEKRRNDRWLIFKIADTLRLQGQRLLGPRHFGRKAVALAVAVLVAFFAYAEGEFRVTSPARVEGFVQRVIAAPIDGYVSSEHVRAGDTVKDGDPLATLDDRDLVLEHRGWVTVRRQRLREFDRALAEGGRADLNVIRAQISQAEAQIALLEERLSRTKLKAPFDGLIVSGDLSQSIGAAVERGEVLFEIAPLNAYRVILEVNETDVDEVAAGQAGTLVLSSFPEQPLSFLVERLTPVAEAKEGRNFFLVEGSLATPSVRLRPGMEGVGKINIDRRRLIWIWTHELVDFLRLLIWRWWP
jgi:RND family efflux transporter MFP subunit